MERALDFILTYAGWIGLGLCALTAVLWHHYVAPIRLGRVRVRVEWADVEAERAKEHAQRAADLKQAAKWAAMRDAQDRRLLAVIKGRSGGDEAA